MGVFSRFSVITIRGRSPRRWVVDQEKAKQWLAKGAQPSDPVRRLFAELGLVERGFIPETKRAPKGKKE